ncbi:hypothetical protein [Pseudomonas syringae]|uniref:hypothetical protein n=1 Tax=Pseudomonas syringae TaxID=317 RepID=UPI001F468596|nr:hypothetical protein [Pseudomonas syringae]MCF5724158.1 hypothetical protein [Pseudomonas syringae]
MPKSTNESLCSIGELGDVCIPKLYPAADSDSGVDGNLGLKNTETPQLVYVKISNQTPPGALVELFCNNTLIPVAHTFVMPDDIHREWLPILLPKDAIRPDWIDPLFCRVNSSGACSRPMRLQVDLERPGGLNLNPLAPGNQSLVIYPADDVMVQGVSEARARLGVEVTVLRYTNRAAGDKLLLCWGDQQVTYSITQADLNRDVVLVVSCEKIMAARDSRALNVRLQVLGYTGNTTDPNERWSAASEVLVFAQRDLLREPYVNEADPQTGVIDLERLGGKPVTVSVFATPDYFEPRDNLVCSIVATDANGNITHHSEEQPIDRINKLFNFEIKTDFLMALAQGHAKVSYALHKAIGGTTMYSQAVYVSFHGPHLHWPAPYMNDTMPIALMHAADVDGHVYVPYQASWKPSYLITLVWLLADSQGTVEYRFTRSAGERPEHDVIEFTVPKAQIKRFEGRTSHQYYEATDIDGVELGESARKSLMIGNRWPEMAAPVVDRAAGVILDPDEVTGGVWVTIPSPPVGADVRLHWFGAKALIEMPVPTTNAGDVRIKVPAKYVLDNLDNIVKVYWMENRDHVPHRYSNVVTLLIKRRGIFGDECSMIHAPAAGLEK